MDSTHNHHQRNQGMELEIHEQHKGISPRRCYALVEPNKRVEAPKELNLPEGWTYEEVPRTNPKYEGRIDKYYYEPGTSTKFRTYQSVLRHLETKKAEQKSEQCRLANGMKFKSVIDAKIAARQEQCKLANGMKFKSVIAAKMAARQLEAIKTEE